jgi:putative DNA primase/helicase
VDALTAELQKIKSESDAEVFVRLAKLTAPEYDRCRDAESKALGIRTSTLDNEVNKLRGEDAEVQGHSVDLPDVELWPEPVDGAQVLSEIADTFTQYVVLPDGAADTLALWTAHTHCFKVFVHTPRLNLHSPEKGCGKTTLLDVLATVVPRPMRAESITCAVLFRIIDSTAPSLLLDECDTYLKENEELRGLLNAGHKRGAMAYRVEGDSLEVRGFSAFAPCALAGIGSLPGTLHDRSIVIPLVRAKPGEVKARFDSRHIDHEQELCRKLARWCSDNAVQIGVIDPMLPDGAFNRLADNWRPFFAIAEIAGGDWPERAAAAFAKLTSRNDADGQGIGTMLLGDIKEVFVEVALERLFSKTLVERLVAMSDRPWGEIRKGHAITENWLAYRLKGFAIAPKTLRIADERAKGYELREFEEAFERYLPESPRSSRDIVTTPDSIGSNSSSQVVTSDSVVTAQKQQEPPANIGLSRCHGSNTPPAAKELEVEQL